MAAPASGQSLEEKRDKKLAEQWLKAAPWITDYDQARAESAKSGKPIFETAAYEDQIVPGDVHGCTPPEE